MSTEGGQLAAIARIETFATSASRRSGAPVCGSVPCSSTHCVTAARSYVRPAGEMTGSTNLRRPGGHAMRDARGRASARARARESF